MASILWPSISFALLLQGYNRYESRIPLLFPSLSRCWLSASGVISSECGVDRKWHVYMAYKTTKIGPLWLSVVVLRLVLDEWRRGAHLLPHASSEWLWRYDFTAIVELSLASGERQLYSHPILVGAIPSTCMCSYRSTSSAPPQLTALWPESQAEAWS